MDRYADGDDGAFAEIYDGLAPRLLGFLMRQTRNEARAEDLVQQTFLKMHRARGSFLRGSPVTPWAFAIARRLFIDSVRRGKWEMLAKDEEGSSDDDRSTDAPSAEALLQSHQTMARVQEELSRLPDNQREAFQLLKQEGLSVAEAAAVLGTTPTAVKLRAHRAYEALRRTLGSLLGREEGAA
jgi:RNA polymerase sigma-70 factor (ECF subfamily)